MNIITSQSNAKRIEFRSLDQAKLYLRICEHVLQEHTTRPNRPRRRLARVRGSVCRPSGYVNYSSLLRDLKL
jgi:hypothetical protein